MDNAPWKSFRIAFDTPPLAPGPTGASRSPKTPCQTGIPVAPANCTGLALAWIKQDAARERRSGERERGAGTPAVEATVEHDFVYCPGCARYAVVHWRSETGQWECEDCSYEFGKGEDAAWTTPATLA
jgi:ribosomal protein L37AE/L43A